MDRISVNMMFEDVDESDDNSEELYTDAMERQTTLTVEEKWQVIFNEKTRAPIYAVGQYVEYLKQFVSGQNQASRDMADVIKKDGINPISYLLRKLKLDLKMSYESFVDEFLKDANKGMSLLVKLLKAIQNTGSQLSGSTNLAQLKNYKKTLTDEHDCLLCIKYSLRSRSGLGSLLEETYGLETVAMGIMSTHIKSRGTAVEILTVSLSAPEGFSRVLESFSFIRLKIGEPVRFKSLMNMLNMDASHNTTFRVSCMKFLNALLNSSINLNTRVFLQHELETAGLDVVAMEKKAAVGDGLEYDDLRGEVLEWNRRYIDIDRIMSFQTLTQPTPLRADDTHKQMLESLQKELEVLTVEKTSLKKQLHQFRPLLWTSSELMMVLTNARLTELPELSRAFVKTISSSKMSTGVDESVKVNREFKQSGTSTKQTRDSETQSDIQSDTADVSCQCNLGSAVGTAFTNDGEEIDDPLKVAGEYLGWQYSRGDAVGLNKQAGEGHNGDRTGDLEVEDGLVKVNEWLRSHCSTQSDPYTLPNGDVGPSTSGVYPLKDVNFRHSRHDATQDRPKPRTDFPGNWRMIPQPLKQFPTRFPQSKTNCDTFVPPHHPDRDPVSKGKKPAKGRHRQETRSQSTDSAIGGSGDRLWQDRKKQRHLTEAEREAILQDMISPDDSASGCPTSEPYPDYNSNDSTRRDLMQKSYRSELSEVLREFEGSLNKYVSYNGVSPAHPIKRVITLKAIGNV